MDDAHLGHLSAAIRSGFVMDDHHVTEEQHAVCAQSNRSHAALDLDHAASVRRLVSSSIGDDELIPDLAASANG
jgi:hypothetical protein